MKRVRGGGDRTDRNSCSTNRFIELCRNFSDDSVPMPQLTRIVDDFCAVLVGIDN